MTLSFYGTWEGLVLVSVLFLISLVALPRHTTSISIGRCTRFANTIGIGVIQAHALNVRYPSKSF